MELVKEIPNLILGTGSGYETPILDPDPAKSFGFLRNLILYAGVYNEADY